MSQSRRHHFVSQFYLRHFTQSSTKPLLYTVDMETRKTFTTSPENVAFERDFHSISVPGYAPDIIEKQLSKMEADVAPAVARILESGSLSNADDRAMVLYFSTLLHTKGPANRKNINHVVDTLMQAIGKGQARHKEEFAARVQEHIKNREMPDDTNIEELRAAILGDEYKISLSTEGHLDLELSLAPELFSSYVATRKWVVYRATAGQFVSCDRPSVLMWSDPAVGAPIGLGLKNTQLLVPLSSTIAICGAFEFEDGAVINLDAAGVALVNGRLIVNAHRQVYARDETFEYQLPALHGVRLGRDLSDDLRIQVSP